MKVFTNGLVIEVTDSVKQNQIKAILLREKNEVKKEVKPIKVSSKHRMKSCSWTPEEDERLYDLKMNKNLRFKTIADILGRTQGATSNRFYSISKQKTEKPEVEMPTPTL